jgi:hypothetical protein
MDCSIPVDLCAVMVYRHYLSISAESMDTALWRREQYRGVSDAGVAQWVLDVGRGVTDQQPWRRDGAGTSPSQKCCAP